MSSGRSFYFYFCRTSWVCDLHLHTRSPSYVRIMHRQLLMDYLSGSWMMHTATEEGRDKQAADVVHLAALQWRLLHPNKTHIPPEELRSILPAELNRFQPKRDWYIRIKPELKKLRKFHDFDCMREAICELGLLLTPIEKYQALKYQNSTFQTSSLTGFCSPEHAISSQPQAPVSSPIRKSLSSSIASD